MMAKEAARGASLLSFSEGCETERCEIWGNGLFVCVLKFDSPLPEDHRVNTLSTADSLRHH